MSDIRKRRLTIPENLQVGPDMQEVTFTMYTDYLLNVYKAFNETGQGIRASIRIDAAFKDIKTDGETAEKPRQYVDLEERDWEMLKNASEQPGVPYPVQPARLLVKYLDAIVKAAQLTD